MKSFRLAGFLFLVTTFFSLCAHKELADVSTLINHYHLESGYVFHLSDENNIQKLLDTTFIKKVTCVEPECELQGLKKGNKKRLKQVAGSLQEVASLCDDNSVDFIFIDGVHNNFDLSFLSQWYEKIRYGGVIFGTNESAGLNEFCADKGLELHQEQNRWWVKKPHFVSFIVPCYNRAYALDDAIQSIYQQNLAIPFEIITCDDGSTDSTQEKLKEYAKQYDNFQVCIHEKNSGASQARNTCIRQAQGDLLFILDSDNFLEPNSIGKLVECIDETGCEGAAFEGIIYFTGNKQIHHTWQHARKIWDITDVVKITPSPISSGNMLLTKKSWELVGGYIGNVLEVWSFGIRQMARGTKITILPGYNYWHRISDDSKWVRNELLQKNDTVALQTFKDCAQVFTSQTQNYLSNYKLERGKFFADLKAGVFKTISSQALESLFLGYRFEAAHRFQEALDCYERALALGCEHQNIKQRVIGCEQKGGR